MAPNVLSARPHDSQHYQITPLNEACPSTPKSWWPPYVHPSAMPFIAARKEELVKRLDAINRATLDIQAAWKRDYGELAKLCARNNVSMPTVEPLATPADSGYGSKEITPVTISYQQHEASTCDNPPSSDNGRDPITGRAPLLPPGLDLRRQSGPRHVENYHESESMPATPTPVVEDHHESDMMPETPTPAIPTPAVENHGESESTPAIPTPAVEDHHESESAPAIPTPTVEDHHELESPATTPTPAVENLHESESPPATPTPVAGVIEVKGKRKGKRKWKKLSLTRIGHGQSHHLELESS